MDNVCLQVPDDKLQKRIGRFGVVTVVMDTAATAGAATAAAPVKLDVEVLKKRAQRFGAVTSTNLVKV